MDSRKQFGIDIINDCLLDECYLTQNCMDCCNKEGRKYIAKYTPSVEILLQVIEQSSGKGLIKPNNIVTSSGSVLVMIFDDFVLKLYQSSSTWNKVVDILECTYECPYVINMRNFVSIENGNKDSCYLEFNLASYFRNQVKIHAIVTDKLNPIITYSPSDIRTLKLENTEVFKLFQEIGIALDCIKESGFSQGDCTFDNIGRIGDRFVLFDFNCVRSNFRIDDDISFLIKSARFNLEKRCKKITDFLNYVSNSKYPKSFLSKISNYCEECDIKI